jgi:hypothetical protein
VENGASSRTGNTASRTVERAWGGGRQSATVGQPFERAALRADPGHPIQVMSAMLEHKPVVLVSGLVTAAHAEDLRSLAASAGRKINLASPLTSGGDRRTETDCMDLTAIVDTDAVGPACRAGATLGQLVLVRDHQLGFQSVVTALNDLSLRCIVLYPHISYDVDVSWVLGSLDELSSLVRVEYFALDLFCDIERSWEVFLSAHGDEFDARDLQHVCERFPSLLSADVGSVNVLEIASFPGARGIFLICDELDPRVPLECHVFTFAVVYHMIHTLLHAH